MQVIDQEMPWFRVLRVVALGLSIVLGVEWTAPMASQAQPNGGTAQVSPTSTNAATQDLPPIQEAEVIEERKPFYKKWWFWVLVGVVVAGGAAAAMGGGGGGGGSSTTTAAPGPGNVNVRW